MINGFEIDYFIKDGKAYLTINSKRIDLMEALLSKVKEWIQ